MDRRGLSLQERNPDPQVRFNMNEHGKVQVAQPEVFMAVGARVVFQLRFLNDIELEEPVF